jgi:transcription initiation factor IIF auxiliary subunit
LTVKLYALLTIVYAMSLMPSVALAQAKSLDIENVAERIADERWQWTAFVSGPSDQIEKIECVQYTLHPTFPDPIKKVCSSTDPRHPFALTATGWGTFNLRARIEFKDGTSREITHYLQF